jgi:hypothetical protein
MAKHTKTRSHSRALVRVPSVKPIVIRQTKVVKAKRHHKHHSRGMFSGLDTKKIIGGAALGFLKKTFPTLPHLPMVGQNGTIALAAYVMRGKVPFAEDVLTAALVVAGYQLASTGAIEGAEGEYVAPF